MNRLSALIPCNAKEEIRAVNPSLDDFTLAELQKYVGGLIQIVPVRDEDSHYDVLVVNEEGAFIDLPINIRATAYAGQMIVGEALLTKSEWTA